MPWPIQLVIIVKVSHRDDHRWHCCAERQAEENFESDFGHR